jgi:acylaminoacyl-peptidase
MVRRCRNCICCRLSGGEARRITELPRGATGPVWSPDGHTLAFSSTTTQADLNPPSAGRRSDVRVIDRPVYRENGNPDYVDTDRHSHIWTVPVDDVVHGAPSRVTDGGFDESNIGWSRDGARILFVSDRRANPYFYADDEDLYSVPAGGGEITRVASIDGVIHRYAVSNDGRRIAFVGVPQGNPIRSYDVPDLFVADADGKGAPRNLTERYDYDIGGGIGGDQATPRAADRRPSCGRPTIARCSSPHPSMAARTSNASTSTPARSNRSRRPAGRDVVHRVEGCVDRGGDRVDLGRPRRCERRQNERRQAALTAVTHFNDALFARFNLTQPEEIWYSSFDGKRIHGWILKPPDFDARRRYPMILEIHGGRIPRTATRSLTSLRGWPRRAMSFSIPTRAAARRTGRTSATASSTTIRATTTGT